MKSAAFQGEKGAYSELAALKYFNKKIDTVPSSTFDNVFNSVIKGKTAYGIIPIENSLSGSIHQNYDLLLKHRVWIVGEIKIQIRHNLIANKGVKFKDIKSIYSHPQALAQCKNFLNKCKDKKPVPFEDTAGSAKYISEEKINKAAAIASSQAASTYKMKIVRRSIEDNEKNFTRFFILSKYRIPLDSANKTSVVFSLKNIPGALYKSLSIFAIRDIDLYKIESRPIPGSPWEYIFYLDFRGDINDEKSKKAINHLKELTISLKILGSYKSGDQIK